MVACLKMPVHATPKIKTCFENQAVAWSEIYNMHYVSDDSAGIVRYKIINIIQISPTAHSYRYQQKNVSCHPPPLEMTNFHRYPILSISRALLSSVTFSYTLSQPSFFSKEKIQMSLIWPHAQPSVVP